MQPAGCRPGKGDSVNAPTSNTTTTTAPFDSARIRRLALHEAMEQLEWSIARASQADDWRERVTEALDGLQVALEAHIVEVEAPDGLLAEILDMSPRFAAEIEEIIKEHADLTAEWQAADAAAQDPAADTGHVRRLIITLLGGIAEHRQRGADLAFDAYNVDIGASE